MNKTFKIYAIIFVFVLVIIALLEMNKTEVTDWRKNFEIDEKSPFGLYVFDHEAEFLFKNKLQKVSVNPYDFYENNEKKQHNILVLEKDIDLLSWEKIMDEVANGSDAMIIKQQFPRKIADSIGFYTSNFNEAESEVLKLTDKKFLNSFAKIEKFPGGRGFTYIKPEIEILGKIVSPNAEDQAGFIKAKFGKGHFFIHSEPLFLTNYYLLQKENLQYAQDVFSYLQDRETLWFTDEKSSSESQSFMRFILANPALRYAWWILLGGLLLFVCFNVKRKQRIIPIIEPLKNSSVDFVKSIGNLYLQEGDFHEMIAKKAQYFLHKVRIDLLISTQNLDYDFAKKLQLKTGKPEDKIAEAIILLQKAQDPYAHVTKDDLTKMNSLLDEILK
ncbi:hypothetical protein SAMN05421796_101628 [Chryseobacterium piscicola]|uniref:DUF4350 domain-containing protein n=1 Tax=Chryseobacterium piscicola TaxID=551459 RepID=A0A1N7KK07_9FLAO|nr:hypothetical protein [Chryseobacterium piscicola]PQA96222.1 hypothetical protein B0A70_03625 [Chryseobacterium piscicola]SIS61951.1 hypothetical protein SAMN05421796_101628 [Chryseobacterium piscicola]